MDPIVISGLGGSGTRVIAEVLRRAGVDIGFDLNESLDDLTFTLLFKRPRALTSESGSLKDKEIPKLLKTYGHLRGKDMAISAPSYILVALATWDHFVLEEYYGMKWAVERASRALYPTVARPTSVGKWAWKEPHAFLFMPWLLQEFSTMKYVHVVRHGFDMAYTENTQQFTHWRHLFGMSRHICEPKSMFEFWYRANREALNVVHAQQRKKDTVVIRYEDFCAKPRAEIQRMVDAVQIEPKVSLKELVKIPSIARVSGRCRGRHMGWAGMEEHQKVEEVWGTT